MLCFITPRQNNLHEVLIRKSSSPFSYREVGATEKSTVPCGYSVNKYRRYIGQGDTCFSTGIDAVVSGVMYNQTLSSFYTVNNLNHLDTGTTVLVVAKHFGIWSVNPVRIVYTKLNHSDKDQIFSLAAGTVDGHMENGEERFSIHKTSSNEIWFEIFSFYKPSKPVFKLVYPLFNLVIHKFNRYASDAVTWYCRKHSE